MIKPKMRAELTILHRTHRDNVSNILGDHRHTVNLFLKQIIYGMPKSTMRKINTSG